MTITRRLALLGALSSAPLCATLAAAQTFPTRPIRVVIPFPAGGPLDAMGRIVAEELGKALGQNAFIDSVGGASGAIAARQVVKADPDGHTIVFGNNQTHGNNMFLLKEPGYDALKDFVPLAGVGAFEHLFVVPSASPLRSIADLIDVAKKDPGKLNYGSPGVGGVTHLMMELFMVRTGTRMTHVPFRGMAPLAQELIAGRIDVSPAPLSGLLGLIQGGQLRALGIASPTRNPALPDVPTLREQSIPEADGESWVAVFASAQTPAPILDKLSGALIPILNRPDVQERLARLGGMTPNVRTPEEFKAYHAKDHQTWSEIIARANIKADSGG